QTRKGPSVYHWIRNEKWPHEDLELDLMNGADALDEEGQVDLLTQASMASIPYALDQCITYLESRDSFLYTHDCGIADKEDEICQKLLEQNFDKPTGRARDLDALRYLKDRGRSKNKTGIIRMIGQLLVPSAEIEIFRGKLQTVKLTETINEAWNYSRPADLDPSTRPLWDHLPAPQPHYAAGFSPYAFTSEQHDALIPFLGGFEQTSIWKGTENMLFPFLTAEAKSGQASLEIADRQNAHSMTRALRGVVELFKLAQCEDELHRKILGFSISHDDHEVRIYAHYPVIEKGRVRFHRHQVTVLIFTRPSEADRWGSYHLVLAVYHRWAPEHFKFLCSAH
ncbi:uncharacterized protein BO80DRAFT_346399, partial [Aspergillus ibericus CBS 121593]